MGRLGWTRRSASQDTWSRAVPFPSARDTPKRRAMSRPSVRSLFASLLCFSFLNVSAPLVLAAAQLLGRVVDPSGRAVGGDRVVATGDGPRAAGLTGAGRGVVYHAPPRGPVHPA